MITEAGLALEFLFSTLQNDTNLTALGIGGVFRGLAPPSTNPPYVIVSLQSSQDTLNMNAYRIMTSSLYQVKVVAPASMMANLIQVASEIDQQLRLTSGSVSNGYILSCYRESPLQIDELVNGELWTNVGGLYRLEIVQV